MLHRTLPDMPRVTDGELEDAGTAASEAAAARAEHHLKLLGELTEIGMDIARSLGVLAKARVEAAVREDRALTAADDASLAGFNKAAQTVRRTIALRDRLDSVTARRLTELTAERARRRTERDTAHADAKTMAVVFGVHDAWAVGRPKDEYDDTVERVMEDVKEHLLDVDEFRGFLDRPVGETVSKLCRSLGVDPGHCVRNGDEWIIRRPPTEFEYHLPPPFPSKEGGPARGDWTCWAGWGNVDPGVAAPDPHPGGSAACPSPPPTGGRLEPNPDRFADGAFREGEGDDSFLSSS